MEVQSKCGGKVYNPNKQFCDKRDDHIYKYVTIEGRKWMAENLAFEYKLPKKVAKKITPATATTPADTTFALDNVGGELKYENTVYENYPATEGRYYTWNSAMGVGDFRNGLDMNSLDLKEKDVVFGACPAGWRLPTEAEFRYVSDLAANAQDGFAAIATIPGENDPVDFNVDFWGYYDVSKKQKVSDDKTFFWSKSAVTDDPEEENFDQAYGFVITDVKGESSVKTSNKKYAFTIRCVRDASN
jgi:uncharacterized protein (TIGR02145 family)